MNNKLMEQVGRISKFGFILNSVDNLECVIETDKNQIQLLLYENNINVLDEALYNIREKSPKFVYKEINMLCDKLHLYRTKYEI